MWVNFNKEEYIMPDKLDPATGCPPGWKCVQTGNTTSFGFQSSICTAEAGFCEAPHYIFEQEDLNNAGFCLKYVVNYSVRENPHKET